MLYAQWESDIKQGTSASRRVMNLEKIGKFEEAQEVREKFPNAFDDGEQIAQQTILNNQNPRLPEILEIMISLNLIPQDKIEFARGLVNRAQNTPLFERDLEIDMHGEDVKNLQKYLIKEGYSIPDGPTDYFGGQTQLALKQYQLDNNIYPAIGYFGPITKSFFK